MGKITDAAKSLLGIDQSEEAKERKLENAQIKEYIVENFAQRFNELQPRALDTLKEKSVKQTIMDATTNPEKDYFVFLAHKGVSGIETKEKFAKEVIKKLKKTSPNTEQELAQAVGELTEESGLSQKKEDIGSKVVYDHVVDIGIPSVQAKDIVKVFTSGLDEVLQITKLPSPEPQLTAAPVYPAAAPVYPAAAPVYPEVNFVDQSSFVDREEERRNNAPGRFGPTI